MPRRKHRHCRHCGRLFPVNPRVGALHRYCSRPECARASHHQAQGKWRRSPKGRDYFQGRVNGYHVQQWRDLHPDYSRQPVSFGRALAAALRVGQMAAAREDYLAFGVGLVAQLSNLALQDTIDLEIRRLILQGHALLKQFRARGRSGAAPPRR